MAIELEHLFPGYQFEFDLRLAFSSEAKERRQQFLTLTPFEMTQREDKQTLDEICDLIATLPRGFGDLKDDGRGPGSSFKTYVESTTDPGQREALALIVNGVYNAYTRMTTPRSFRPKV